MRKVVIGDSSNRPYRELIDPAEAGVDPLGLDILCRRVALEVASGHLPSARIAIARHVRLVASRVWGADESQRYILQ